MMVVHEDLSAPVQITKRDYLRLNAFVKLSSNLSSIAISLDKWGEDIFPYDEDMAKEGFEILTEAYQYVDSMIAEYAKSIVRKIQSEEAQRQQKGKT